MIYVNRINKHAIYFETILIKHKTKVTCW